MSNHIFKAALTVCLLLVLCSTTLSTKALTAEELYSVFGITYESGISKEDLETIQNYNQAKRYVQMFRYVAESEYDKGAVDTKIDATVERMTEIETSLLAGFDLPANEIYDLESEYRSLSKQLEELQSSTVTVPLDYSEKEPTEVPTYEEYLIAVANKNLADSRAKLGDSTPTVMTNTHLVSDFDETTVTYASTPLSVTTSLFNGVVVYSEGDTVTINHYNNIFTSYKGLTPCVEKGDTIGQGQCIGYSSGILSVRMKVGGQFVNIHSYLEENDEL